MAEEPLTEKFRTLSATEPGKFLYEVYRDGPFANLAVRLSSLAHKNSLKRTWAVNPAYDGLTAMFNFSTTNDHRSLRQALNDFKTSTGQWEKQVERKISDGRIIRKNEVDLDAITPASLIASISEAVVLSKAIANRNAGNLCVKDIDFCERTILPLLKAMPPQKSAGQYFTP